VQIDTLLIMRSAEGIFLARPETEAPGISLAVKDLFDPAGLVTTYGSSIFSGHVPTETAEAVRRLEAAGYTNVGKTNLHEFAYGVTSMNPHYGWVPNPVREGRIAGGSSGGSAAALVAGLADAALGTDSGGSIRIPAAFCGIVGFKPTYGLVSLDGCWPLAPSYDHAGPMARTVADCVAMMEALVPGFAPAPQPPLVDLRVAVSWLDDVSDGVRARVEAAAALFPNVERIDFPRNTGHFPVFFREIAEVHESLFSEHADQYGDDVAWKLREWCFPVTDAELAEGARAREALREEAQQALEGFDLLLTPTQPFVAPTYEEAAHDALRTKITRFTNPFNALGWPALALPCGGAEEGLPASVQLVARPGDDAFVLAAGAALEAQVTVG
jgi:aspartyl-tRNA(Asn)/glutamyl-tRNA(Gln) amidotransferase subunit A